MVILRVRLVQLFETVFFEKVGFSKSADETGLLEKVEYLKKLSI